ncbi:MAG: ATP-binding protein, partial [Candidatus Hodarchaeota archaeon]
DLFCDGLGACIGHCPEGAILVEKREAEPYDERRVMENVVKQGQNVIKAHLEHLKDHNQTEFFNEAVEFLKEKNIANPLENMREPIICSFSGSLPSITGFRDQQDTSEAKSSTSIESSQLQHWPVQLRLVNPNASFFKDSDLLIVADCVPVAFADFHQTFLKDKTVIMFCPKLDSAIEEYIEKLAVIFKHQNIQSISLTHMQVACCFGIKQITNLALEKAGKKIPISEYVISPKGEIL